jgi:hypothetical protein
MRVAALALALTLAALSPAATRADETSDRPHVAYRATYEAALLEARIRNVPVFVSRHKDGCGRCTRQYQSVLVNPGFVKWANERVVVVVPHNELGHEPIEVEGPDGEVVERCPLYPGLTCREHLNLAVDVDVARGEDLIKVPFLELHPNSWLVLPTGTVEPIAEADQFVASKIEAQAAAAQKALGPALPRKAFEPVRALLEAAQTALDDGAPGAALGSLAKVAGVVEEPAPPLVSLLDARLAAIEEDVAWRFEQLLEDEEKDDAGRRADVEYLLKSVSTPVFGKTLPSVARMKEWLGR